MGKTWHDFEKAASGVTFGDDGTFTLGNGKSLSHSAGKITVDDLRRANGGLDPRRFAAGRRYRMPLAASTASPAPVARPSARRPAPTNQAHAAPAQGQERAPYPGARNNPGNLRNYWQGWLGEDTTGLGTGDFIRFDTPQNGLRAASRLIRRTLQRSGTPTINSLVPIYSPTNENDVARHTANIVRHSGIPAWRRLDVGDDRQMTDLLGGVVSAETSPEAWRWFTPEERAAAVRSGRTSL